MSDNVSYDRGVIEKGQQLLRLVPMCDFDYDKNWQNKLRLQLYTITKTTTTAAPTITSKTKTTTTTTATTSTSTLYDTGYDCDTTTTVQLWLQPRHSPQLWLRIRSCDNYCLALHASLLLLSLRLSRSVSERETRLRGFLAFAVLPFSLRFSRARRNQATLNS